MAFASSLSTSMAVPCLPSSQNGGRFSARFRPTLMVFPRHSLRLGLSTVACARRRSTDAAASKKKKKQRSSRKDRDEEEEEEEDDDDDDMDGDAFEALFKQLEEDLKNDTSSMDGDDDGMMDDDAFEALFEELERDLKNDSSSMDDDDDDDITEENFVKVERALAEAFDEDEEEEDEDDDDEEDEDDDDEEEEEEEEFKLKNWQFRRIASALKVGRRKLSIKLLAEELCLDRAVVLKILRDPPPKLLMYSASLPDYVPPTPIVSETETEIETEPVETVPTITDVEPPEPKVNAPVPVHVRQSRWSGQKRLKKVHALTLEQVYRKTKRPNDAMVDSIVLVTNLPRKVIVKWFEEKRAENGVPDKYPAPYQRSAHKTGVPEKYSPPYKRSAHKTPPSQ